MDFLADLMNDLVYAQYALNRSSAPEISPNSLRKVYGPEVDHLEARYQAERAIAKAAG
jgi:hypothetical protein